MIATDWRAAIVVLIFVGFFCWALVTGKVVS